MVYLKGIVLAVRGGPARVKGLDFPVDSLELGDLLSRVASLAHCDGRVPTIGMNPFRDAFLTLAFQLSQLEQQLGFMLLDDKVGIEFVDGGRGAPVVEAPADKVATVRPPR